MKPTTTPGLCRSYTNLKKANWDRYRQEVDAALRERSLSTDWQKDEKIFRTILLKAASHHIPTGQHRLHEESVPAEILDVMTRRDDLRKRDPTSAELPRLNYDIQNRIYAHKRQNGEILLGPWTRRLMSPSCGEPLKELIAEQNVAPNDTAYTRWSCHSGLVNPVQIVLTTTHKVLICDICHRQIQVRKQISIRCNRIEHWVHLRCAGIRLAQYADTWTCHQHIESRLTAHKDITPPHPSRTWPMPTNHPLFLNTTATKTQTHIPLSTCSSRIGKAQTQSCHPLTPNTCRPEPNTYTYHTLHLHLSIHSSIACHLH